MQISSIKKESTMIKERIITVFILLALDFFPTTLLAVPSGKSITWKGGGQGTVKFEGREHAEKGYNCESCHPSLFEKKKGSAKMTMDLLNQGKFCGACHNGKTAFGTDNPKKCHECHKTKNKQHGKKDKQHD
jgi:c(7)-type cytochrome triheme protein